MPIRSRLFPGAVVAVGLLSVLPYTCLAEAQVVSHSKNVVIVLPASLPELAQRHGIAFQLYSGSGDGRTYLYIEQHQGQRLLVLDVTNPAHVKQVNAVSLAVPGTFDFGKSIGSSAMLIRFHDSQGTAVLNLRNPKSPSLRIEKDLNSSSEIEPLGTSAVLMASGDTSGSLHVPRDFQVVDTSNPTDPVLLCTVKQVTDETAREDTGTTFLLGSQGLTIIRRPQAEERFRIAQSYTN